MGKSKIEWTDRVWNPVTGCTKVSAGCTNCYAERITKRFYPDKDFNEITLHEDRLNQPLRWRKPSKVFVCSMSDLFHDDVPLNFIDKVFDTIHKAKNHTFLVLTKRPENLLNKWLGLPLPNNCWIGVTAENQEQADKRIPILLQIPAAKRFVSVEPMLGAVDLSKWLGGNNETRKCRRIGISGCIDGGTRDRQSRTDMESSGEKVEPVGKENCFYSLRSQEGGKRQRDLPANQSDDGPKKSECVSASSGLETFSRPYTRRNNDKSQRRQQKEQQPGEFGISNILKTDMACLSRSGVSPEKESLGAISWVICGGESGPGARPMHPDWARNLRDQCVEAGVPFLFKQWGEWEPFYDRDIEDPDWKNIPQDNEERSGSITPKIRRMNLAGGEGFHGDRVVYFRKVGKKKAGRLLDGKLWDEYPERGGE